MKKDIEFIKKYNEYFKERQQIECAICEKENELYGKLNSKYTKEQIYSFYKTKNTLRESISLFYIMAAILLLPTLMTFGMEDKNSLNIPFIILIGVSGLISLIIGIIVHVKKHKIKKLLKLI